jgi:hypothetical protein
MPKFEVNEKDGLTGLISFFHSTTKTMDNRFCNEISIHPRPSHFIVYNYVVADVYSL